MRDANPGMAVPIKKKISSELFFDRRAELYIQKNGSQNFLAKLKRVKCWRQDQHEMGTKNQNSSLFRMSYISMGTEKR